MNQYLRVYGLDIYNEVYNYNRTVVQDPHFGLAYLISNNDNWMMVEGLTFDFVYGIYIGLISFETIIDRDESIPEEHSPYIRLTAFFILNDDNQPINIIGSISFTPENKLQTNTSNHGTIVRDLSPKPDENIPVIEFDF